MKNAWQYTVETQEAINQICKPLERLGLKFMYERLYKDGTFFVLVSHLSNIFEYIEILRTSKTVENTTRHYMFEAFSTPDSQLKSFLSPLEFSKGQGLERLRKYRINGVFSFFRKKDNYVESWNFISDKPTENIDKFYLQNITYLEQFVHYFNQHSKDLREGPDPKKLILPKLQDCIMNYIAPALQEDISDFLKDIEIKNYDLNVAPDKVISLSKREVESLHHLSLGKSAKEIARTLGISDRTIETHINNIKNKSGIHGRSQLISTFLNSDLRFMHNIS